MLIGSYIILLLLDIDIHQVISGNIVVHYVEIEW